MRRSRAAAGTMPPFRQQSEWRERSRRTWANCESGRRTLGTFRDKFELVAAEIARIEGRTSTPSASTNRPSARHARTVSSRTRHRQRASSRFYLGHGLETNGLAHLRNARACFALWAPTAK